MLTDELTTANLDHTSHVLTSWIYRFRLESTTSPFALLNKFRQRSTRQQSSSKMASFSARDCSPASTCAPTFASQYIWILWIDENQQRLDAHLKDRGFVLLEVSTIIPLEYDFYEVMVDAMKIDKLREELPGLTYAPFDKNCALVRNVGEHGALKILLNSYARASLTEEQRNLAKSHIKGLEEMLVEKRNWVHIAAVLGRFWNSKTLGTQWMGDFMS